ncbi:MAG: hypothetical protein V1674_06880 [Candidatus Omnitrophota bacterium]
MIYFLLKTDRTLTPGPLLEMSAKSSHLFSLVGADLSSFSFSTARHFPLTPSSFGSNQITVSSNLIKLIFLVSVNWFLVT